MMIHTVQSGESVYSIAQMYRVPMRRIITDNELQDPARLAVGQTLVIRFPEQYHVVEPGQTLAGIAARHGMTVNELYQLNPALGGLPNIVPGQTLVISLMQPKLGTFATNGYAYPNIDRAVLRQTLPYLTYLSVFSYGFNEQGNLLVQPDTELIALAKQYGTKPLLVLTTLREDGSFSTEHAHVLLNDVAIQDRLIENLARTMTEKGYDGLDIDFEYISPEDATAYAAFVSRATNRMNALGFETFVALAPKTSALQRGLLYEGHDYAALGQAANNVLLMTYEWGYSGSAPMAVAPINKVREVVDYAATEIDPRKTFLGVPNYGYDWTLPHVQGKSRARSLGNVAAVEQAILENAAIQYDETAQSPHYEYWHSRIEHEVWFEDARSIGAKLALAAQSGLRGFSVWQIMRWFPQLWLVLSSQYHIEKSS